MKVLKRASIGELTYTEIASDKIRIILGNGKTFDIEEDVQGYLEINKIDGSININPRYGNEITIN
jgi:hypothetical protein